MERFRRIGEALGSLKALMVFRESIQINQRQCILLHDMFSSAYDSIAEEIRQNLQFEEKNIKWKVLEQPFRDLNRVFREGEAYVNQCLESKDWFAKAITLYQNTDCVEFHIHNLLCCISIVVEAVENAAEVSGEDHDDMQKKKQQVYLNKYKKEWTDPQLFQWKFAKQYLATQDFCNRFDTVYKEDRWILLNKLKERKNENGTKQERRLTDLLLSNASDEAGNGRLLPSSILVRSKDYQVRRRLGSGSQYKEIIWLGESFAMRHFFGDIEALTPEISLLLSLSHPNIVPLLCGFSDDEKRECFLVMELMSRSLCSQIKEVCGPRKRNVPFSLPVAVDLMLQIARGMEYLHSKKIYHGDLNPSNVHVKSRDGSTDGYLHAKVSGFGLSSVRHSTQKTAQIQSDALPFIWHAPEVLEEQEQTGTTGNAKYSDKADVYSFGMVCFELLTGKVPFEDSHLQGDKMSRNIRAGERPLFPFNAPRFITNLTKRCWNASPNQRPSFSSICRILRYVKRFIAMNPGDYNSQSEAPVPLSDYSDIESKLLKKFPSLEESSDVSPISQIPFQMFAYRVIEDEKTGRSSKENSESPSSDRNSCSGDENVIADDPFMAALSERRCTLSPPDGKTRKNSALKKSVDVKLPSRPGTPKGRSVRPPQVSPSGRSMRMNSESQLTALSPRMRRSFSGHNSDSEVS